MYKGIQDILNLAQSGHYQIACTKYFEAKHGTPPNSTAINHPNQFFEESQRLKGHLDGVVNHNDELNHNGELSYSDCKFNLTDYILLYSKSNLTILYLQHN